MPNPARTARRLTGMIAAAVCLGACGEGLYDRPPVHLEVDSLSLPDAVAPDAPADRGPDAPEPVDGPVTLADASALDTGIDAAAPDVAADAPPTSVTKQVGPGFGSLELPDAATLSIASGVLPKATQVTLRAAVPERSGTIGPTYEVEVPPGTRFQGNPRLEIAFQPGAGIQPARIRLAFLMHQTNGVSFWVAILASSYDTTRKVLGGEATNLGQNPTLQFAPVLSCTQQSMCPPQVQCAGNVCQ